MSDAGRQLPLIWPVEDRFGADDFLVGEANRRAFELVARWPDWPEPILRLTGPAGVGKSHLAAIFAERSGGVLLGGAMLDADTVLALEPGQAIIVDACDGGFADEQAMFHLLNRVRASRGSALLVAQRPPQQWGLAIADLLSRLRQAPAVAIEPPDDALFKAILVKLFHDRQLVVDASVVDYLALRLDRSVATARDVVSLLDRQALSLGRRITRPITAGLLRDLGYGAGIAHEGDE